jgi:hypothetical protein
MRFDPGRVEQIAYFSQCRLLLERVDLFQNYCVLSFRKEWSPPTIHPIMPHFIRYSIICPDNQNCTFVFERMHVRKITGCHKEERYFNTYA